MHAKHRRLRSFAPTKHFGAQHGARLLLSQADDGHQPAGAGMLAAITEEKVSAAGRAQLARNDVRRFHTSVKQLPAVGCAQVEPDARRRGVVTLPGHREAPDWALLRAGW